MDSIKQSFIRMSILPIPNGTKPHIQCFIIIYGILSITIPTFLTICSTIYFFQFIIENLANALHALVQAIAYNNTAYLIAVAYLKRRQIEELFSEIKSIESVFY